MGQAKRRGTFEQRLKMALAKKPSWIADVGSLEHKEQVKRVVRYSQHSPRESLILFSVLSTALNTHQRH